MSLEERAIRQANNGRWDLFMATLCQIADPEAIERLVRFQQERVKNDKGK